MTDLTEFKPASADEFMDQIQRQIGSDLTAVWKANKKKLERNLRVLGEATVRTALLLETRQITEAEADAILYQQEQLFNATLNHTLALPYIAAQSLLNTIFKVVGWAVFNYSGVNLFPALVTP
ncbi:hypothetical protein [Brevundimonas sp. FT23028]|uniref:hypothetical protein n=1 Tax=Brevundimonas sp. FT23028 TaxID=3393748 RepID=UPI003B586DA2